MVFVLLTGCAGSGNMSPLQTDMLLVRAGFQLHTADTPKKLDFLKSLPQNELVHKMYDEKMFYFYADGSSCKCVYVGDDQAYLRFKQSVKEEKLDDLISTNSSAAPYMGALVLDPSDPFNLEDRLP